MTQDINRCATQMCDVLKKKAETGEKFEGKR